MGSDHHLGMIDQSQDVTDGEDGENYARHAQSSLL
jgi:hypothetical protein